MPSFTPDLFRSVRHYAGKLRTIHNEIRTERFMNSLPEDIRKDIGWPDRFARRNDYN
ncbi:MAG: hypothetical protein LCH86_07010 [Proteobacteria bacterium]|uniref:hypothetical protein n=1 Tax=Hyphomicrobiales TaxID=356 RepID=UPI0003712AB9|nr:MULTISPECIES: hypothetical protein [Phyllobacteriaceae]MCA0275735.1 hypothetical protein [Pseudomonadota bacterium]MCX8567595.1 hypothetical protein [Aminobacter sp. MET-1]